MERPRFSSMGDAMKGHMTSMRWLQPSITNLDVPAEPGRADAPIGSQRNSRRACCVLPEAEVLNTAGKLHAPGYMNLPHGDVLSSESQVRPFCRATFSAAIALPEQTLDEMQNAPGATQRRRTRSGQVI